jgi:hypothetical protein
MYFLFCCYSRLKGIFGGRGKGKETNARGFPREEELGFVFLHYRRMRGNNMEVGGEELKEGEEADGGRVKEGGRRREDDLEAKKKPMGELQSASSCFRRMQTGIGMEWVEEGKAIIPLPSFHPPSFLYYSSSPPI